MNDDSESRGFCSLLLCFLSCFFCHITQNKTNFDQINKRRHTGERNKRPSNYIVVNNNRKVNTKCRYINLIRIL
jgi:hypothetical protein